MQAVTIDSRVAALEKQLIDLTGARPALLAELQTEIARIRNDCQAMIASAVADEARKREALEARLTAFEKKVDGLVEETAKQTASLDRIEKAVVPVVKTVGSALDTPLARKLIGAIGVAILTLIATWLGIKGFRLPQ